jgi:hypothetical protein
MKTIISFSIDRAIVEMLREKCALRRISFSQYAEYALSIAPAVTEELAVKLARKRRGLEYEEKVSVDEMKAPEAAD